MVFSLQQLSDQKEIDDFIEGKSDREVAVASLTMIDRHEKVCAERWAVLQQFGKWILSFFGLLIFIELAKLLKIDPSVIANIFK